MENSVTNEKLSKRPKKASQPTNRIVVSREAKARIEEWSTQIEAEIPGFQIAKVDLMNWMICARTERLTSQEIQAIRDEFFDRGRCIRLALKELAAAQKSGDEATTKVLIKRYAFLFESESPRRTRKTSSKAKVDGEAEVEKLGADAKEISESGETKDIENRKE